VTILLPVYNEVGHVEREIERITAAMNASRYSYDLDVYDDGSTDGSPELLQELDASGRFPRMRVMCRPRNGGSGTVRRIGTQNARGDIVAWTDADLTYPNERLPEFVEILERELGVDQIVGARTSEAGTYRFFRVPAKWMIRRIAGYLTETQIPDLNSGMRVFRRSVSQPYLRLLPPGFSCVTTLTVSFLANGHEIIYVPIEYSRREGHSKFHFIRDAYLYILQVLRMVMYFNPLKVLMPIALTFVGLGAVKMVTDVIRFGWRVPGSTLLIVITGFQIAVLALLGDLVARSRPD
jgi:glycosyltransferase involved in cell wall biosynthesis